MEQLTKGEQQLGVTKVKQPTNLTIYLMIAFCLAVTVYILFGYN